MREGRGTAAVRPPGPDLTTVRSRRRFARRQRARRWLRWKRVLSVLVLLALLVGGVWLVFFSSTLAVQGVDVEGAGTVSASDVRRTAAVPQGDPLATVDLDAVRARVEAMAPVKSADVSREWPDRVLVRIQERTPIAVAEVGDRLRALDADGVLFRDYRRAPAGLPHVLTSIDTSSEALQEAARVVSALPTDLTERVDHVQVETVDKISLALRDGRTVVWGTADQSADKARVLAVLLRLKPQKVYDVSVPGSPVTSG
jgi:cell division protein FtsQ